MVASRIERHRYIAHEYMNFNAKMHVEQVCTKSRGEGSDLILKVEVFLTHGISFETPKAAAAATDRSRERGVQKMVAAKYLREAMEAFCCRCAHK